LRVTKRSQDMWEHWRSLPCLCPLLPSRVSCGWKKPCNIIQTKVLYRPRILWQCAPEGTNTPILNLVSYTPSRFLPPFIHSFIHQHLSAWACPCLSLFFSVKKVGESSLIVSFWDAAIFVW
jgi:hypothetical protein